jgi:hypothetical protein
MRTREIADQHIRLLIAFTKAYRDQGPSRWRLWFTPPVDIQKFWRQHILTIRDLVLFITRENARSVVSSVIELLGVFISIHADFAVFVFEQLYLVRGAFFTKFGELKWPLFEELAGIIVKRADRTPRLTTFCDSESLTNPEFHERLVLVMKE